jgi:L-malate glycosyltransferase
MKIAYIYDNIYPYSTGGVEKRIWELAKRLGRKNHEVHIFGPKYWKGSKSLFVESVYFHGICKPPKYRFIDGRRSIIWPIKFSLVLFLHLFKYKFDVIDCQNFPYFPCFAVEIISILKRSRLLITWHEVWGNYWYEYLGKIGIFGKIIEILSIHLSSEMISVSELTAEDLRLLGYNNKVDIIPNGVNIELIKNIEKPVKIIDIIFVGRLIKEKNIDIMIQVIGQLRNYYPNINCTIIGDGPERTKLELLTSSLNLQNNIKFLGFVRKEEQIYQLIKSSRIFLTLSTREGFGIVALEANACGVPVITIRHPRNAICELIKEKENGILTDFSVDSIINSILFVLNSPTEFADKCKFQSSLYNWDNIIEKIEKVYAG